AEPWAWPTAHQPGALELSPVDRAVDLLPADRSHGSRPTACTRPGATGPSHRAARGLAARSRRLPAERGPLRAAVALPRPGQDVVDDARVRAVGQPHRERLARLGQLPDRELVAGDLGDAARARR